MKLYFFALSLLLFILFSCTSTDKKNAATVLNSSNLPAQFFSVNINQDTTLVTASGCILQIAKGSLQSDSGIVKLNIKEVLSNSDIVMAGLSTMSGKKSLSSGGMIYFNAAEGYQLSIKKAIKVLVPTKNYERNMQVYKGDSANGKLNWENPQPLPPDETTARLDSGKTLFMNTCSSCHKIDKDFTAPALYGITERRSKEWIYAFTRHRVVREISKEDRPHTKYLDTFDLDNPKREVYLTKELKDTEQAEAFLYHECLRKTYRSLMPIYNFSDKEIDAIYTYVKNETAKLNVNKVSIAGNCCDSCIAYFKALMLNGDVQKEREDLIKENESFFSLKREIQIPAAPPAPETTTNQAPLPPDTKVKPVTNTAVYYSINITAVGWYNIDILMKDYNNCTPSELMVRIQGNYKIDFNVTLIIPSVKAFIEGGKLSNGEDYGFDENDGKIPLPVGAKCIVMAYAEQDGKILFGKTSFDAQSKQNITLEINETTKAAFKIAIKAMKLDSVSAEIKDSKNAEQIRKTDKKIEELKKLKPKNCNCDIPMASIQSDALQSNAAVTAGDY